MIVDTLAIVGTGLIGGSFSLALKQAGVVRTVLGVGRNPARPFSTSTLQQDASRKLGFSADLTMKTAQRLFELFPNLGEMPGRPGGRMSGGEQQMLTVARTLMGNPRLVLLDEPSEGVAPVVVEQMARTIVELKKEGLIP